MNQGMTIKQYKHTGSQRPSGIARRCTDEWRSASSMSMLDIGREKTGCSPFTVIRYAAA
jgi:hypothetical protein